MNEITVLPLFSSPIYINNIESIPDYLKNYCYNLPFERFKEPTGSYSKNKKVLEEPELFWLKQKIIEQFNIFAYDVLSIKKHIKFRLTTSWVVKFSKNDYAQMHRHSNSVISGIVYLKTGQTESEGGKIKFLRKNPLLPIFDITHHNYNIFNSEHWDIQPKENCIIMFLSDTLHSVTTNSSDNERYSLAFNFFPSSDLGEGDSFLELK